MGLRNGLLQVLGEVYCRYGLPTASSLTNTCKGEAPERWRRLVDEGPAECSLSFKFSFSVSPLLWPAVDSLSKESVDSSLSTLCRAVKLIALIEWCITTQFPSADFVSSNLDRTISSFLVSVAKSLRTRVIFDYFDWLTTCKREWTGEK